DPGGAAHLATLPVAAAVVPVVVGGSGLRHPLRDVAVATLLRRVPVVVVDVPGADVPDRHDGRAALVLDLHLELMATLGRQDAPAGQCDEAVVLLDDMAVG